MSRVVLDSSALLAYTHGELGANKVASALSNAMMSSVNVAEVVTKLALGGMDSATITRMFREFELAIADFTAELALDAGLLAPHTKHLGQSLGDRACLALAHREGAAVLTTDRAWRNLDVGVEIELIR